MTVQHNTGTLWLGLILTVFAVLGSTHLQSLCISLNKVDMVLLKLKKTPS